MYCVSLPSASDRIAKSLREQEAELQFHDAYAGEEGVVYPGLSAESQRFKEERARRHLELEQQVMLPSLPVRNKKAMNRLMHLLFLLFL